MFSRRSITALVLLTAVPGVNSDAFNYRKTSGDDYGPADWDRVRCGDLDDCVSYTMSDS